MLSKGTGFCWALLTAADLVLCAVNVPVSMPDKDMTVLIHQDRVLLQTSLYGFTKLINKFLQLLFLNECVLFK